MRQSTVPHTIVRAAPFFATVCGASRAVTHSDGVHVAPVLIRPVSARDVADTVAQAAVRAPLFGALEVAEPDEFRLDSLTATLLAGREDSREVITEPRAAFFGALLEERTLLPRSLDHMGSRPLGEPPVLTRPLSGRRCHSSACCLVLTS
ncbi:hypothetical protein [Streptomyces sp. NPDC086010]|uniref:hypothetical protein n=1 Tax=Streptomyces sp. NPDC086010 TaxID=3365745 RepID=UPI0037D3A070